MTKAKPKPKFNDLAKRVFVLRFEDGTTFAVWKIRKKRERTLTCDAAWTPEPRHHHRAAFFQWVETFARELEIFGIEINVSAFVRGVSSWNWTNKQKPKSK
jgi:hypothetical protein